jgi:hypothetical protein
MGREMNYTDLQTAIADWFARKDLPLTTFIQLAEQQLNRSMRVQAMEEMTSATPEYQTDNGLWYLTYPVDYVELKHIEAGGVRLEYVTNNHMASGLYSGNNSSSWYGSPLVYTMANQLLLFPSDDEVDIYYYKKIPELSDSNLTNWFTEYVYDGLLYLALGHAASYMGVADTFSEKGLLMTAEAQGMDDIARTSGAPLVQRG